MLDEQPEQFDFEKLQAEAHAEDEMRGNALYPDRLNENEAWDFVYHFNDVLTGN